MRKLICFSILFLLFNFLNVYADDSCTKEELKKLKELATNVSFKYDYEIIDIPVDDNYSYKTASYKITAYNLNDELKVKVKNVYNEGLDEVYFTKSSPTIKNFINGDKVKIEIIAHTANYCSGKVLITKIVNLPNFNIHSLKEECVEYPDFKYCSEFGNYLIDDTDFEVELENYKKSLEEKNPIDKDVLSLKGFITKYMFEIVVSLMILIVIIILIIVVTKKSRRDKDLI